MIKRQEWRASVERNSVRTSCKAGALGEVGLWKLRRGAVEWQRGKGSGAGASLSIEDSARAAAMPFSDGLNGMQWSSLGHSDEVEHTKTDMGACSGRALVISD